MIEKEIIEKVVNPILNGNYPFELNTGFEELDSFLHGIDKSSLVIIGGEPSMGKTSFLQCIMTNLLEQNHKCLYFSLEMGTKIVIEKMIAQLFEVEWCRLKTFTLNDMQKEKVTKAAETIQKFDLTIYDDVSNINTIQEKIEQLKPEFVFIDYLQLLDISEKSYSESSEIIMRHLKQIARENNCLIFITSKVSESIEQREDKKPLLSDIIGSNLVKNIADVVLFIYRESYYQPGIVDEQHTCRAEIIIAKNKFGPIGSIALRFKSPILKFFNPVYNDSFQ